MATHFPLPIAFTKSRKQLLGDSSTAGQQKKVSGRCDKRKKVAMPFNSARVTRGREVVKAENRGSIQ
jgi:hypothetical protein